VAFVLVSVIVIIGEIHIFIPIFSKLNYKKYLIYD